MVWEALALGAVQGATEFLPISSSAHLTLLPRMLGWSSPLLNSLAFDVALHLGTLVAVLGYFWRDVVRLLTAWAQGLVLGRPFGTPDARLAWFILAATLPVVAFAVVLEPWIETTFRTPMWVAVNLVGFGLLLGWAELISIRRRSLGEMTFLQALAIGLAQALALMPGVSRSGATLTAGLALGFQREEAARFSFLLMLPVVTSAVVHQAPALATIGPAEDLAALAAGSAASTGMGLLVIHWLLGFLRRRPVYVFVAYRCVLAAWALWAVLR